MVFLLMACIYRQYFCIMAMMQFHIHPSSMLKAQPQNIYSSFLDMNTMNTLRNVIWQQAAAFQQRILFHYLLSIFVSFNIDLMFSSKSYFLFFWPLSTSVVYVEMLQQQHTLKWHMRVYLDALSSLCYVTRDTATKLMCLAIFRQIFKPQDSI